MDNTQRFLQTLESKKQERLALSERLKADNRLDEANMEKIRANVYDVAAAVTRAAEKQSLDNPAGFAVNKLASIAEVWETALAEAERHGAYEKIMTERVKLETAGEILKSLNAIAPEAML